MTSPTATVHTLELATGDRHDLPYRFGKPLTYLSERQQARLLLVRGRLQDAPATPEQRAA